MKFFNLIPYYFTWHYTKAINNFVNIWTNYLWFTLNYFSIKTLFLSLFLPYRKLTEDNYYKKTDEEHKVVTIMMIIVGVFLRLGVLLVGFFSLILNIFIGVVMFFVWILLPIISTALIVTGVIALIK